MSTETTNKTTAQVANRLVELCREGKILDAEQELFADNITCIEPAHGGPVVTGKAAVTEKSKQFDAMMEEVHGGHISDPVVCGNWFSIGWMLDATMKGRGRQKLEEICVYKVENGQIVLQQFFY